MQIWSFCFYFPYSWLLNANSSCHSWVSRCPEAHEVLLHSSAVSQERGTREHSWIQMYAESTANPLPCLWQMHLVSEQCSEFTRARDAGSRGSGEMTHCLNSPVIWVITGSKGFSSRDNRRAAGFIGHYSSSFPLDRQRQALCVPAAFQRLCLSLGI